MSHRYARWERRVSVARSIPILDLAERLGIRGLRKAGRQFVTNCPLHDDRTPSFFVDPALGLWNCLGCAKGGDGIRLWQEKRGLRFADAVRELVP